MFLLGLLNSSPSMSTQSTRKDTLKEDKIYKTIHEQIDAADRQEHRDGDVGDGAVEQPLHDGTGAVCRRSPDGNI